MSTILDRLADVIELRKPANGGDPAIFLHLQAVQQGR